MDGFLLAFAVSAAVVFVAELGDKSQLMALTFATRYRTLPVLAGITIATSLVHLLSVAVGHGLGNALPTGWISLVAAVAFLGFGAWTLRGDSLSDAERAKAQRSDGSAVAAVTVAFFLAELGDKTMLATITLATQHGWFGVWLGSTLGMVAADALAIVVGRQLGRRLPERAVKLVAAGLFLLFGVGLGIDAADELGALGRLDHHVAGWAALVLAAASIGLGSIGLGTFGGRRVRGASAARRALHRTRGTASRWADGLFAVAALLGLAAPLLVGADLIQPIALFVDPGIAVVGAGLGLLGVVVLLSAQVQVLSGRGDGADPATVRGLYARVRNPGLTGMVVVMAGTLLMVPTLLAVLATVVLVVAVQVQVRGVREPGLARLHGSVYVGYTARTGRFLPRVLPPDGPAGLRDGERARVG